MDYLSFFFDRRWRYPKSDIISLMIKMADDSEGAAEGRAIHKGVTEGDKERLKRGVRQCRQILARMGIRREETFLGILNAGHPGGMLPLVSDSANSLHDARLPGNLYVADSTIFPEAAGLPPILTIMALSMKVAGKVREGL